RAELVAGRPIARELALGQSHTYRIAAEAGDFVQVTVEQQGLDVAATLVGSDGREVVSVDAMDDEFRPEVVVAIVETAGSYEVRVQPAPGARTGGRYAIRSEERR